MLDKFIGSPNLIGSSSDLFSQTSNYTETENKVLLPKLLVARMKQQICGPDPEVLYRVPGAGTQNLDGGEGIIICQINNLY